MPHTAAGDNASALRLYHRLVAEGRPEVLRSLRLLDEALRSYGLKHLALSFNGGKDCTVLLHLLRAAIAHFRFPSADGSCVEALEAADREDQRAATAAATAATTEEVDEAALSTEEREELNGVNGGVSSDEAAAAAVARAAEGAPVATASSAPVNAPPPPSAAPLRRGVLACVQGVYFVDPLEFDEVESFLLATAETYGLHLERVDSGSMLEGLARVLAKHPVRAILMGQRRGDPGATATELAPTDAGWPAFMRVNPILQWTYGDVWHFLRAHHLPYCSLYDLGYTSLGNRTNTLRNELLRVRKPHADGDGHDDTDEFLPAYMLEDGSHERDGRVKRKPTPAAAADGAAAESK